MGEAEIKAVGQISFLGPGRMGGEQRGLGTRGPITVGGKRKSQSRRFEHHPLWGLTSTMRVGVGDLVLTVQWLGWGVLPVISLLST